MGHVTRGSHRAQTVAPKALVERLGAHPATEAGLDLSDDGDVYRWFALASLLSARGPEEIAVAAFSAMRAAGLDAPSAPSARSEAVLAALAGAGFRRPEATVGLLARADAWLGEQYDGSLGALAGAADDVWDLAGRIAGLAPGVGRSTVLRFLRPLRDVWPAAREVPLAPAARAAAVHLAWIREGEDEDGEPGALRAALAAADASPGLRDVEAALERLGSRACLREKPERCPLGSDCPARSRPRAEE